MNVVQFVITERDERLTALAECRGSKGVSIKGDPDRVDVHVTIDGERTEVLKRVESCDPNWRDYLDLPFTRT